MSPWTHARAPARQRNALDFVAEIPAAAGVGNGRGMLAKGGRNARESGLNVASTTIDTAGSDTWRTRA
jgi:hypothetical protein